MKIEVSLMYARKAQDVINDNNYLRRLLEQTYSNVWENPWIEDDDDAAEDLIETVMHSLEVSGIPSCEIYID